MNDKDQDTQHRQSAGRINERIEAGEYEHAALDQRLTEAERDIAALKEAVRKLTTGT